MTTTTDLPASLGKFKVRYKRKGDGKFTTLVGECFPSHIKGGNYVTMILDADKNPNEPNMVIGKPNYRTLIIKRIVDFKAQ